MAKAKPKAEKAEKKPAAEAEKKEAKPGKKPEAKREEKPKKERKEKVYNPWKVLRFPHLAEKSMNMVELENKLVFIVDRNATKAQVREAVERGFATKVGKVNLEITQKGVKKAYVKLIPENAASDIASRLGML